MFSLNSDKHVHCMGLSLQFALMLQVKLPFVDRIQPQSNVAMNMENRATVTQYLMNAMLKQGSKLTTNWSHMRLDFWLCT